jgi:hypothetical protein
MMLNQDLEEGFPAALGDQVIPAMAFCIIDSRMIVQPPEAFPRAGKQAMVPVIVGANDPDLSSSPAQTKDTVFALFGPLAPTERALYDPKDEDSLKDLIKAVIPTGLGRTFSPFGGDGDQGRPPACFYRLLGLSLATILPATSVASVDQRRTSPALVKIST